MPESRAVASLRSFTERTRRMETVPFCTSQRTRYGPTRNLYMPQAAFVSFFKRERSRLGDVPIQFRDDPVRRARRKPAQVLSGLRQPPDLHIQRPMDVRSSSDVYDSSLLHCDRASAMPSASFSSAASFALTGVTRRTGTE